MSDEIKVTVFERKGVWYMQYRVPGTKDEKERRSTGIKVSEPRSRRKAQDAAAVWQAELREGRYQKRSRITWEDFRVRYHREYASGLANNTGRRVDTTFNSIEAILKPHLLADITADRLARYASIRRDAVSERTIKTDLAHLRAALVWAVGVKLLAVVPEFPKLKRAKVQKKMKGRPITAEEFERMLAATPKVVGEKRAASWKHYLTGLWWSGLRLDESMHLHWTDPKALSVDFTGQRPMLLIEAGGEKGNQDRILPMAPEFAEFLGATAEGDRVGFVFTPEAERRHGDRLGSHRVGEIVAKIGKKAGVKVSATKFASAHDLRRSFGERWSKHLLPQDLMLLMRHESIDTTLRYYVGRKADSVAEKLWSAVGDSLGDIDPNATPEPQKKTLASHTGGEG